MIKGRVAAMPAASQVRRSVMSTANRSAPSARNKLNTVARNTFR
jgi:hypothetical protein